MRHHFRALTRAVTPFVLVGSTVLAQTRGPIQERILGQRIEVPPISERIQIAPIEEGPGAFSALPTSSTSRIVGVVINERGLIVPSAGFVLIRSLRDGKVIGQTQVDTIGQFSVPAVDPGLYAAELIDGAGSLITSSPSFTVGVGQIVQITPVVSQSSIGGLASILGNTTGSAVNAAANAGVVAVAVPLPVSPGGPGR